MTGKKQAFIAAKNRYVPHLMLEIMIGVTITIKKLKSQFEQVESALALARVLIGLISAGYSLLDKELASNDLINYLIKMTYQGRGNHVAPKLAM
jgi:hypothetical protein